MYLGQVYPFQQHAKKKKKMADWLEKNFANDFKAKVISFYVFPVFMGAQTSLKHDQRIQADT